jgi:hypothetical protein
MGSCRALYDTPPRQALHGTLLLNSPLPSPRLAKKQPQVQHEPVSVDKAVHPKEAQLPIFLGEPSGNSNVPLAPHTPPQRQWRGPQQQSDELRLSTRSSQSALGPRMHLAARQHGQPPH